MRISWTEGAEEELLSVYEFYLERNGSSAYNRKIEKELERVSRRIKQQPFSYPLGSDLRTRFAPVLKFQLLYLVLKSDIYIVSFWDPKQDPDKRFDRR